MADRYWVGGSGNWDATSTTNWATSSGGSGGASAPTSADNVIFDANSNVGTSPFTVTVLGDPSTPALCNDFSASSLDGVMTLSFNPTSASVNYALDCYGSMTLPAANFTISSNRVASVFNYIRFKSTSTGKTITTNGVSIPEMILQFDGVGGEWSLGGALTVSGTNRIVNFTNGTFNTANFSLTTGQLSLNSGTKVANFGSSTISLGGGTPIFFETDKAGFTLNAGTSTIVCSNAAAIFDGGGFTYYNVEFSGGAGTKTINGANTFSGQFLVSNAAATGITFGANQIFTGGALIQATSPTITGGFSYTGTFEFASTAHGTKSVGILQTFQNLKVTTPSSDGITNLTFSGNCTVSGTLTTTDGGSTSRRVQIKSNISGTQRTLTVATNSLINTDFQDIIAAGAASWVFGLGYGDLGNNSGITFDTSTLYWIGGTGNWSDGTKWSTSSGGSAANAVPAPQNSVIFDAGSNTGTNPFTVTVTGTTSAPSVCNSFSTGGAGGALDGAMTLDFLNTSYLDVYGSLTLPATNFSSTGGGSPASIRFKATTTGKTVTTNGVVLPNITLAFDGVGGAWTLGSAISTSVNSRTIDITNGTFNTGNYNVSWGNLRVVNAGTQVVNLGSSTLTFNGTNGINITETAGLTWNAGTSQITISSGSPIFVGGGLTFYNVSFTSAAAGNTTIAGANTFNNLTQTSRSATGIRQLLLSSNQTINGTLTLGAANTAIRRIFVSSDTVGSQRTITLNGTLATLADIDFRDINAAGTVATPWTGTRLGNCLGNSNITFDAAKTVYWNLSGTQNWSATGWATTNNGTPAVNNFPLAQDTATFTEAGAAGTVTIDTFWSIGSIQMADGVSNRTTTFTLASSSNSPRIFKNVTFFSNLTLTGTATFNFWGQGTTQTITSAGVSFSQPIAIDSPSGTVQLLDNLTTSSQITLSQGTIDLSSGNRILTCNIFSSSNSNTRSISFGTGNITVTGNNATVWGMSSATNFSFTGTPIVNLTYSGSTGTRTISGGNSTIGGTESNAVSFNITAGSDIITTTGGNVYKSLNFTGFSGTLTNTLRTIYQNLVISAGMSLDSGVSITYFVATSGTQQITTNSKTLDFPIIHGATGTSATLQLQDNLTIGSTRTFTLTAGTLDLSSGNRTLSTGLFSSSNSNTRAIAFGTGNITLTGSGTTVWGMATATNFTYTGTPIVNCTYSGSTGARIVSNGGTAGITEANSVSFNISAGTDIFAFSVGSAYKNINFTGFSGTFTNATRTIYGNLTISSGMSLDAGSNTTTFAATSGTQQLTSNGKTLDFPITIDGVGTTVSLQDALTMGSTRTLTLTNGTFTTNNYNVTCGRMLFNTGTKTINMGSSTFTLNGLVGSTASWYVLDGTNLTINSGTSTISLNEPYAVGEKQGFYGGGFTYYNLNIANGCDSLIYGGSNTFNNISNTFYPVVISFEIAETQTVNNFTVSGSAGNLVTLQSSTPGNIWYLTKTSGTVTVTYCDITDSDANGGATFNCINGVNGGNNTGWNFSSSSFSSGNFLAFF